MLKREIGLPGAVMMGLGSIIGTGVFVSIGLAADVAGAAVLPAVALAAAVATCNALSSAQLAANHPVSGGTYEYGYRYLTPSLGFAAGWMFLCAKSASAAAAAIGFAGYLLTAAGGEANWLPAAAVTTAIVMTCIVFAGIRLSSQVNVVIVSITLVSLLVFVAAGMADFEAERLQFKFELPSLLEASALMFVAFTGYGRIATLGEEVVDPRRTIPRAIIATLLISMSIYLAVAATFVGGPVVGLATVATSKIVQAAPLENAARRFSLDIHWLVALGAMMAMLGVLLNLLLGLSRVMLAMGRRGDMPRRVSNLGAAVVAVGAIIAALAATGSVKQTWSFSAFTVLIYYAVTNLAALQIARADRLYSPAWAVGGLAACLALALSIELKVAIAGGAILAIGLAWHWLRRRTGQSG